MPLDVESARLLFLVVPVCYECSSVMFAIDIKFGKCGAVLGDEKLAAAIIVVLSITFASSSLAGRAGGWMGDGAWEGSK